MAVYDLKMWSAKAKVTVVEVFRVPAPRIDEMCQWLADSSRPGSFAHFPRDLSRHHIAFSAEFAISDPNVAFEFKMLWG